MHVKKLKPLLNRQLTESMPTFGHYPPIGDMKSPVGDNIPHWVQQSRELTENIFTGEYYPQLAIWNPQLEIGYNISNLGLGIYESGNKESENK